MAIWNEQEITYTTIVEIGDIISSHQFHVLLFRDKKDKDPMRGFYVNPRQVRYNSQNHMVAFLEDPGFYQDRTRGANVRVTYKHVLDEQFPFVVIYTEDDCDCVLEYDDEMDHAGHYPLLVKARRMTPWGSYDPFGEVITFHMHSELPQVKHKVDSVVLEGRMKIHYIKENNETEKDGIQADKD